MFCAYQYHALRCLFQMFLQKGAEDVNLSSVQMPVGNLVQQGGALGMHGQVVSAGPLQNSVQQQHAVQPLSQQQTLLREKSTALAQVRKTAVHAAAARFIPSWLVFPVTYSGSARPYVFQSQRSSLTLQPQQNLPASLYNTMMIPQQSATNVVQIATSLAQNPGPNTPAVATFARDQAAQIRFATSFA